MEVLVSMVVWRVHEQVDDDSTRNFLCRDKAEAAVEAEEEVIQVLCHMVEEVAG